MARRTLSITLPRALYDRVSEEAEATDRPKGYVIRLALEQFFGEEPVITPHNSGSPKAGKPLKKIAQRRGAKVQTAAETEWDEERLAEARRRYPGLAAPLRPK